MDTNYDQIMVCNGYHWKAAELQVPIAESCQQLYKFGYSKSGVYSLRETLNGTLYKTYCDMNGGWTLLMKINGNDTKLGFDDPLWTNKETLNSDALEDDESTKLVSYWTFLFTELRLGMKDKEITRWITLAYNSSSLYDLIADEEYRELMLGRDVWKSLISNSSLQIHCNKEGFNVEGKDSEHHAVRIGIIANENNDCNSTDSRLGFGGMGIACVGDENAPVNTCGNSAGCEADNGDVNIPVIGYIMAR